MSADDGIYILQSKDGYRIIHAQAIENLYWWNIDGKKEHYFAGKLNPKILLDYFGDCEVFKIKEEAYKEADRLYNRYVEDFGYVEYGINFIYGWEDKEFPE